MRVLCCLLRGWLAIIRGKQEERGKERTSCFQVSSCLNRSSDVAGGYILQLAMNLQRSLYASNVPLFMDSYGIIDLPVLLLLHTRFISPSKVA